jgi:hypothetical protein
MLYCKLESLEKIIKKNKNRAGLVRMRAVMREMEESYFWGSLILFCCFTSCLSYENSTRSVLPAKPACAELCLQLIPLNNILSCRKIRRGLLRTPEFSEYAG